MAEIIEKGKEIFSLGRLFHGVVSYIFLSLKHLLYWIIILTSPSVKLSLHTIADIIYKTQSVITFYTSLIQGHTYLHVRASASK